MNTNNHINHPVITDENIRFYAGLFTDVVERKEGDKDLGLIILEAIGEKYGLHDIIERGKKYSELRKLLLDKLDKLSQDEYANFIGKVFDFLKEYESGKENDYDFPIKKEDDNYYWILRDYFYQEISDRNDEYLSGKRKYISGNKKLYDLYKTKIKETLDWMYEKQKLVNIQEFIDRVENASRELDRIYSSSEEEVKNNFGTILDNG